MKMRGILLLIAVAFMSRTLPAQTNQYYPSGRAPLLATKYAKLPFGAVTPQGWLSTELNVQANALTGHLDEIYTPVKTLSGLNLTNEYIFPYYEGLILLAYLRNDSTLIKKAKTAIDYFINSQKADGNFLSSSSDTSESFNHMSVCRVMTEYYEMTGDSRVIPFMTNYFHYVNKAGLAGNITSVNRKPDHIGPAYWLYNHTGDTVILNAITKTCLTITNGWRNNYQNFTYKDTANKTTNYTMYVHNVNLTQAYKYALYYLQSKDSSYKAIYTLGLPLIDKYHGSVAGRFNADENLTGKQPTRGMELCGVVEMAFSMEMLFEAFGDIPVADRAEYLMLNCFPGTNTADLWAHQYDQQANQVLVNNANRPWNTNNSTSNEYGLQPNYPCCLCNVHQAWPRYVEYLWMATQNNGLLASMYGPCRVSALVGSDSANATITETTEYPFDGTMGFKVSLSKTDSFPICFRIPSWETNATVQTPAGTINPAAGSVCMINRTWHTGDSITVTFPMAIRTESRWKNSICVMRGPLWYSLKIGETWKQLANNGQGSRDWEIDPNTAWNVGLKIDPTNPGSSITVVRNPISSVAPFAQKGEQVYAPGATSFTTWTQDPPVVLKAQGRILTNWKMDSSNASDPPVSPLTSTVAGRDTSIELIPYGSAKLRVTEMPWINLTVGVHSSVKVFADNDLEVNASRNGKCLFTVRAPGAFALTLFDMAGRIVYRHNADGPLSFVMDKGIVGKGNYVVRLTSGSTKLEKKVLLFQ